VESGVGADEVGGIVLLSGASQMEERPSDDDEPNKSFENKIH